MSLFLSVAESLGETDLRVELREPRQELSLAEGTVIVMEGAAGATCSLATRPRRATGLGR